MEWMTLSGGVPCHALFTLGTYFNGKYYVDENCLSEYNLVAIVEMKRDFSNSFIPRISSDSLEDMCEKLNYEDPTSRPVRRALAFTDVVNRDLSLIHI